MSQDDLKVARIKKVLEHGDGPHAIPLAQLTESILLNEKLDQLLAKEAPEMPEYPEIEIPEFPSEITVANLPEVQKVEITNLPKDKDDKEQLKLLKQIAEELKKKEQYAYDIEVDSTLKEQLRGEKGEPGKDGIEITPEEVRDKLLNLNGEDRLDASAIKGLDNIVKETKVYGSRLLRNLVDVNGAKEATDGQVLTKQADGTFAFETPSGGTSTQIVIQTGAVDPTTPEEGQLFINTTDNGYKVYYGGSWQTLHTLTTASPSYLLQEDGSSFVLQEDGVSKVVLQ